MSPVYMYNNEREANTRLEVATVDLLLATVYCLYATYRLHKKALLRVELHVSQPPHFLAKKINVISVPVQVSDIEA